jgi:hypothetical protein
MKSEIMNYTEEIELIYSEAQILLNEIFTSYRKVTGQKLCCCIVHIFNTGLCLFEFDQ